MTSGKWSVINILKGRTVSFLILTYVLTVGSNKLVDKLLNAYIRNKYEFTYATPVLTFNKYWYVLIIPSAILSIIIIKLFLRLTDTDYTGEISLHPYELKKSFRNLLHTIKKILTHRMTKYIIIIGLIVLAIGFLIEFVKIGIYLVATDNVPYRAIAGVIPPLGQILVAGIGLYILKVLDLAILKEDMLRSSKYGIRLSLISLVLLVTGFGIYTSVLGLIFSVFGAIKDSGIGRKAAIYGGITNTVVIMIYALIIYIVMATGVL